MSLKVAYRNWAAEGVPHVHLFDADAWSVNTSDGSLLVRNGSEAVACISAGEWIAVWRPEAVETVAPAAPAGKAQKASQPAPAAEGETAPAAGT
jgi:hypothetical protein